MITSSESFALYSLLSAENNIAYHIPHYQREYTWTKDQWDALVDDLLEADEGSGHFLGTIICVNVSKEVVSETILELIDGQQRMTTLSLLLLALYSELRARVEILDEDSKAEYVNLRKMLVLSNPQRPRLRLQRQNQNQNDYLIQLANAGLDIEHDPGSWVGNRKIQKALKHFQWRISQILTGDAANDVSILLAFLGRVKQSVLVKLEVASHSDAFTLFESLNNRGVPLTPIDLIKTLLRSLSDKTPGMDVSLAYRQWETWLEYLGDDYGTQERFFRQFYNAFKSDWAMTVPKIPIATRSKLIRIYEHLVRSDLTVFIERMGIATKAYGRILGNGENNDRDDAVDVSIRNLSLAQGTPAYMLVLFLLVNQDRYELSDKNLVEIVKLLVRFFVRRNLTNTPPTYDLDRLFIGVIEKVMALKQEDFFDAIRYSLLEVSASDEDFMDQLRGPIYEENVAVARFILVAIAQEEMTKESLLDLWARQRSGEGKQIYVWTVEHILPQGENLPDRWLKMLGGADEAFEVQSKYAHTIGNLTISGYNSALGNKSFDEKKNRRDKSGKPVGYNNGLNLNQWVFEQETWGEKQILERTEHLAARAFHLFRI
jgi:hypothetical protein